MRNFKKYSWVFVILILVWQPIFADNVELLPIDPADEFGDDPPSNGSIHAVSSILLMFIIGSALYLKRIGLSKK